MKKTAKKKSSSSTPPSSVSPRKKSAKKASDVKPSTNGDSSTEEDVEVLVIDDDARDIPEDDMPEEAPVPKAKVVKKKASKKKKGVSVTEAPKDMELTNADIPEEEIVPYCNPGDGEIVYPIVNVIPYFDKRYNPKAKGPLTAAKAKEFLGWEEEQKALHIEFKSQFLFHDRRGNKIRCTNNLHNRSFNKALAEKWMLEILRRKWKLNGETCIIDCKAMTQDAQHRLAGLAWAVQEWEDHPGRWRKYWKTEPTIDTIVVTGIPDDDETVNTINTGKPRTLADVIFRSEYFQDIPAPKRVRVARNTEWCIKLIWRRSGQKALSKAPGMPHSEAIEFVDRHERLLQAVRHVYEEDGGSNLINGYVSSGQAAGLLYLMATSTSDRDEYVKVRGEEGLDFKYWDKACDFWTLLSQKSEKLEPALDLLLDIPEDAFGPYIFALRCGVIAKSWDLFRRGKPIKKALIKLKVGRDEFERPYIMECPLIGGIDIGEEVVDEDNDEEESNDES